MNLTYKYRLLPSKAQHRALERILEDQRHLYNAAMEERIACYRRTGKGRRYVDQTCALTECRKSIPEMAALAMRIQRHTLKRVDWTYGEFFRHLRERKGNEKVGFPRFKGSNRFNSFGFSEWKGIRLVSGRLRFKGVPGGLRVHFHRPIEGRLLGCVFQKDTKGWSVSFNVEIKSSTKRPIVNLVGVDLGIKTLVALSDGTMIPNPEVARKTERDVRRRQRQLARCKRGSRRRSKVKSRFSKLHKKIANTRRTYLHQQSAMLVRNYDLIAIEALNIAGLSRGLLSRPIHDAGWGTLVNFIKYKAEYAGACVIEVDPKRTSQECPNCGEVAPKTLAERTHSCACGCVLDRDVAAARVILNRAVTGPRLANVAQWGCVESETSAGAG